jgi:hypothetical protein
MHQATFPPWQRGFRLKFRAARGAARLMGRELLMEVGLTRPLGSAQWTQVPPSLGGRGVELGGGALMMLLRPLRVLLWMLHRPLQGAC